MGMSPWSVGERGLGARGWRQGAGTANQLTVALRCGRVYVIEPEDLEDEIHIPTATGSRGLRPRLGAGDGSIGMPRRR